jgi:hypothetical protein
MVFAYMSDTIKEIAILIDKRLYNKKSASVKLRLSRDQFIAVDNYVKLFEKKSNNVMIKKKTVTTGENKRSHFLSYLSNLTINTRSLFLINKQIYSHLCNRKEILLFIELASVL